MPPTLRFEPMEDPSGATRVWHFDELPEDAQDYLSTAAPDGEPTASPVEIGDAFEGIEVVKFTDYFRVERA